MAVELSEHGHRLPFGNAINPLIECDFSRFGQYGLAGQPGSHAVGKIAHEASRFGAYRLRKLPLATINDEAAAETASPKSDQMS